MTLSLNAISALPITTPHYGNIKQNSAPHNEKKTNVSFGKTWGGLLASIILGAATYYLFVTGLQVKDSFTGACEIGASLITGALSVICFNK